VLMPDRDVEARRQLEVLEAVALDGTITQRNLSSMLGIALGLTNVYLRRLVHKGYIKCVNLQSNRILYLITPIGIAEKTRLTYEFMQYSLHLYGEVRRHLRDVLRPLVNAGRDRIAIYGTGEAAELAYLSLKELASEPVAILSANGEEEFLGMRVMDVRDLPSIDYDRVIIATLDNPDGMIDILLACGTARDKLICLHPEERATGSQHWRDAAVTQKAARR
jgi:DNA-binding MarR family transcriptional regulator